MELTKFNRKNFYFGGMEHRINAAVIIAPDIPTKRDTKGHGQ